MSELLVQDCKIVQGLAPCTPSSSTPDYVSLKGWDHLTVIISCDNATSVTGSDITLKQATDVSGSNEKALAFSKYWANTDTASGDTLTETAASSNTFTTDDTDNKNLLYVIEVDADTLDTENGFDCVRAGTGNASNTVIDVVYILSRGRYASAEARSAIAD